MAITIALLGGESSGKTTLAQALHQHMQEQLHIETALVPEQLRLWCQAMGRAPRAEEQPGACARKFARSGFADAARGAGDEDGGLGQIGHGVLHSC